MSRGSRPDSTPEAAELLRSPRFEVMPIEGFGRQLDHLTEGATVAITASPTMGLDATIDRAVVAADRGFEVIPHVAARSVRDLDHLGAIVDRLTDAGITDLFVPAGDRDEPIGEFGSAYGLITALRDLENGVEEVGITGYPEGHPVLADETLEREMDRKRSHATYITTQLCYDPDAIVSWIARIRDRGVELPVYVGIPGVVTYGRLLRVSRRVGVGESIRVLRRTSGFVDCIRRLVGARGPYTPDDLVDGLVARAGNHDVDIDGLHIYTLNRVPETEAWRRRSLDPKTPMDDRGDTSRFGSGTRSRE